MHSVRVSRRASTQHWNVRAPIGRSGLSLSLAPDALSLRRRDRGSQNVAWGKSQSELILPLLAKIEDSIKPVIMAIHGTALGGGLEVAMAGHYRVAIASAQLGGPKSTSASSQALKVLSACHAWFASKRRSRCGSGASP